MVAEEPFFFDVKKIHSDTETLLGSHFAHLLEAAIPHADPRTGSISAQLLQCFALHGMMGLHRLQAGSASNSLTERTSKLPFQRWLRWRSHGRRSDDRQPFVPDAARSTGWKPTAWPPQPELIAPGYFALSIWRAPCPSGRIRTAATAICWETSLRVTRGCHWSKTCR